MHNKFVMEKLLNHTHISINEKKMQNLGRKGNIN